MIVINDWMQASFSGAVLSIGNFDGVHRGHQAILSTARERARRAEAPLVVMTFEPHPSTLLTPDRVPPTLTSIDVKLDLLARAGVDAVVVVRPTIEFLAISAEAFITDVILARFAPIALVEGPTFGFGAHRRGDVAALAAAGRQHGFEVEIVPPVRVALGGRPETIVSSSLVRHLLASGTVDGAALCLARPYALFGTVQHGVSRGRTLGFPTANLPVGPQLIPAEGVYAGRAFLDGLSAASPASGPVAAAISIGRNPTFDDRVLSIEAFLLDFEGDVYGRHMRLEFLEWLRPQQKFATPADLVAQIGRDVERTREVATRGV